MTSLLAPVVQGAGRWSAEQVHDTVAAIVRQPEFATPLRQSLAGRVLRYVADRVGALIELLRGSASSRVIVITAVILIILVIVARILVARRVDAAGAFGDEGKSGRRDRRRDPWADARDRAAAGDYEAATHFLYAAVIETLARGGRSHTIHRKRAATTRASLRDAASPAAESFERSRATLIASSSDRCGRTPRTTSG